MSDTTPIPGGEGPDPPANAPRWFLVLVVLIVALVGIWLLWSTFGGGRALRDAGAMPEHTSLCGRGWVLSHEPPTSLAAIRAREGVEPVVVDVGLFAPCPPGPCTNIATPQPCYTVVHVRVGDDAYVAYELEGGP